MGLMRDLQGRLPEDEDEEEEEEDSYTATTKFMTKLKTKSYWSNLKS